MTDLYRQTDEQVGGQKQAGRQADRQAGRQAGRQAYRHIFLVGQMDIFFYFLINVY